MIPWLSQCPYPGYLHFHSISDRTDTWDDFMSQCPYPGYLHFHEDNYWNDYYWGRVSMPLSGLPPFPPKTEVAVLRRAGCLNALIRATSISTSCSEQDTFSHSRVSMPLSGLPPFPPSITSMASRARQGLNALIRATSISTQTRQLKSLKAMCLNALIRATSISTVGSGRPQKQRLSERHFEHNCQTTPKFRIIQLIFGLLKILRPICYIFVNSPIQ